MCVCVKLHHLVHPGAVYEVHSKVDFLVLTQELFEDESKHKTSDVEITHMVVR